LRRRSWLLRLGVAGRIRAGNGSRARDLIRATAIRRLAEVVIDVDGDAGVGSAVRAGEGDEVAAGVCAGAGDLDLGALHVELGAARGEGVVQGKELDAHEVMTRGDALWHVEVVPAVVGNHLVDGPDAVVEAALGNLEPLKVLIGGRGGVVDLGEVDLDRTCKKC